MIQYNTNYVAPRSGIFRGIKITLIVLQVLNIIGAIYLIAVGFIALGVADDQTDPKDYHTLAIVVIVSSVIGILLAILGLLGALKEHFYLVLTYGVIVAILAIANLVARSFLYGVINLIVAFIAFYFAYLINKIRGQNLI